jgi:hypothetical protein
MDDDTHLNMVFRYKEVKEVHGDHSKDVYGVGTGLALLMDRKTKRISRENRT